jgi:hypothetical protein
VCPTLSGHWRIAGGRRERGQPEAAVEIGGGSTWCRYVWGAAAPIYKVIVVHTFSLSRCHLTKWGTLCWSLAVPLTPISLDKIRPSDLTIWSIQFLQLWVWAFSSYSFHMATNTTMMNYGWFMFNLVNFVITWLSWIERFDRLTLGMKKIGKIRELVTG